MQVPQWAGPIPMGRRGGPGLSAMSRGSEIPVLIFFNYLVIDSFLL